LDAVQRLRAGVDGFDRRPERPVAVGRVARSNGVGAVEVDALVGDREIRSVSMTCAAAPCGVGLRFVGGGSTSVDELCRAPARNIHRHGAAAPPVD